MPENEYSSSFGWTHIAMSTNCPRTIKGITHEQRYQLCLKKQECPGMKQAELAAWFKAKYSFSISQPTISHSLKTSAETLARGLSIPGIESTRVRNRPVRHPKLEMAIYQWVKSQQQLHQQQANIIRQFPGSVGAPDGSFGSEAAASEMLMEAITGPVLMREAKRIAKEMNIDDTVFCPGWLSRFKARYGLKSSRASTRSQTDELSSSDNSSTIPSKLPSSSLSPMSPAPSPSTSIGNILDQDTISSVEVRPSIAVPSNINSAHDSIQQLLRSRDSLTSTMNGVEDGSSLESSSVSTADQRSLQQQPPPQQHPQQRRQKRPSNEDTLDCRRHRRHPYQPPPQVHNSQQQPHNQSLMTSLQPSTQISSMPPSSTTPHLDFLHSIPISPPTNPFQHTLPTSSSLPSSPMLHSQVLLSQPCSETSLLDHTPPSEVVLGGPTSAQSFQDAQRLVFQLRQYVGLHLQDPSIALQSIEALERELEPMRTRESITIAEMD